MPPLHDPGARHLVRAYSGRVGGAAGGVRRHGRCRSEARGIRAQGGFARDAPGDISHEDAHRPIGQAVLQRQHGADHQLSKRRALAATEPRRLGEASRRPRRAARVRPNARTRRQVAPGRMEAIASVARRGFELGRRVLEGLRRAEWHRASQRLRDGRLRE